MSILSLKVGSTDITEITSLKKDLQVSLRAGLGATATFVLDFTGITALAPDPTDRFILTVPTGEKLQFDPIGEPETKYRSNGRETVILYTYECIDPLTGLDRKPLPVREYFESTAGEIIRDLIGLMDSTLDTSGVQDGNSVPYLTTEDFSKFSDVIRAQDIVTGGYILQLDPSESDGLYVIGDYKTNFPATGLSVDYTNPDFSPFKEEIVPDNEIINYQKVKGASSGGPDHKGMEFRELDALQSTFQLAELPYGLDGVELLNVGFDGGGFGDIDADSLPKVIPLHHPVTIEVSDINPNGSGEICSFVGRSNVTALGVSVSSGSIGVIIDGSVAGSASLPLAAGAQPADGSHQYAYDWYAEFVGGGLRVTITEYYIDATASETPIATVTAVDGKTLSLSFATGKTINDIPNSIRFLIDGDPNDILGYANIVTRTTNTIDIDVVPEDVVGTTIASGDFSQTTTTDEVIYSGSGPTRHFGKPVVQKSGSGTTARQWVAQYGCPVQATLLDNPYTGALGRPLKVNTVASRSADLVISKSGNTAVCQLVTDRLPLTGDIRLILNYDVSKRAEAVVEDLASQERFGIRAGEIIESEFAVTVAECQALGQAVIDDRAFPPPKGTIQRESILMGILPVPSKTFHIKVPAEYRISEEHVPISEVSISYAGYDPISREGVLMYSCTLGNVSTVELIERQLLTNEQSFGTTYRPITISGPSITNGTWNDIDNCTVSISGGGSISIGGKSASGSFNPADYAPGNLRSAPVKLKGTVNSGGKNHTLAIELIYPPEQIDPETAVCHFNASRNEITFNWKGSDGGIEYRIKKEQDPDGDGNYEYQPDGSVFFPSYSLAYEPHSKNIKVQVVGLAEKVGGDYVELVCELPQLPAPDLFEVVKVRGDDTIVTRVSAPPVGRDIKGRTRFAKLLVRRTDPDGAVPDLEDPDSWRAFFPDDNDDVEIVQHPITSTTALARYKTKFEDTDKDDVVWISFCWVDIFGDEGQLTEPFDATRPPITVGHIDLVDFFQSAPQSSGGVTTDDDEQTALVEFTGVFRVHLGRHNKFIRLKFEESTPTNDGSDGSYIADGSNILHTDAFVEDADVVNGYIDIVAKQKFRSNKKKQRTYRPTKIVFEGVKIRERLDSSDNESAVIETVYAIGTDPFNPSQPTVPYAADAYFDKEAFKFKPWTAMAANSLTAVTIDAIAQKPDGFRLWWKRINEVGIRRYMMVINEVPFGTRGPGSTAAVGTDLDAIDGRGALSVYDVANNNRNINSYVVDVGDVDNYRFFNGDTFGDITITAGVAYYVSIIAQAKTGRWCTSFSTVYDTLSGEAATGDDAAEAVWVNGSGTIITNPNSADGLSFINLRVRSKAGSLLVKVKRPNAIKASSTTGTLATPHIIEYGVKLRAGDGSNNWLNPEAPGTPITSDLADAAEFIVPANDMVLAIPRADLASVFKTNGFIAAIRPYNFVASVRTAGTYTSYTSSATSVVADAAQDTENAGAALSPELIYRKKPGYRLNFLKPTSGGINSILAYYVSFYYSNGTTVSWMNPESGAVLGTSSATGLSTYDEITNGFAKRITNTEFTLGVHKASLVGTVFLTNGIKARIRAVNIQNNVETYSTTIAETTGFSIADDDTIPDIGIPSPLTNPGVKFKGGFKITIDTPTVNMRTYTKTTCFVTNSAGTTYWNPITNVTSGSPIEFEINKAGDKFPFLKSELPFTSFRVWYRVYNNNVTGTLFAESGVQTYSLSGADFAEGDGTVPATPNAPNVTENFGAFFVSTDTPGTNINTIIEYQTVMSTSSTKAAGNPSVGTDGVVKIRYGQSVEFRRKTGTPVDLYFYTRVKNENGYSLWSSAGSVLATAQNRPSTDSTGNNVVTLLTTGDSGFTNFDATGTTGGTPMYVARDTSTNNIYVWFFLSAVDGNYFSLTDIQVQLWRKNGIIRFDQTYTISENLAVVIPVASLPDGATVRCRMRNSFRNPSGAAYVDPGADVRKGWSAWSKYVDVRTASVPAATLHTFDSSGAGSGIVTQGGGGDYQATLPDLYTNY